MRYSFPLDNFVPAYSATLVSSQLQPPWQQAGGPLKDAAGNYLPLPLPTRFIDTFPVHNGQPGGDVWRNSNAGVYDIDFADGRFALSKFR